MAKMEYSAECLCGGKIITSFKKPTRMQHSVSKTICNNCKSEFQFTFSVQYSDGAKVFMPEHEVVHMTEKLLAAHKALVEKKTIEKQKETIS